MRENYAECKRLIHQMTKTMKNDKFEYCILDALHRSFVFRTSCHIFYLNKWTNEYSPIETIVISLNFAYDPRNLLSEHSNNSDFRSLFVSKFHISFCFHSFSFFASFQNSKRPRTISKAQGKKSFVPFTSDHVVYIYDLVGKIECKTGIGKNAQEAISNYNRWTILWSFDLTHYHIFQWYYAYCTSMWLSTDNGTKGVRLRRRRKKLPKQ